jgi:hypothetical protein
MLLTVKIESILKSVLPTETYIEVRSYNGAFGDYIKIMFAAKDFLINNVSGQRPQAVSLRLSLSDMELTTQVFGGNGGQSIYREPNLEDPKEKYLAMKSVKVPFRKPKNELVAVEGAIKRFAENWLKTLEANKDTLRYKDIVDYSKFF